MIIILRLTSKTILIMYLLELGMSITIYSYVLIEIYNSYINNFTMKTTDVQLISSNC